MKHLYYFIGVLFILQELTWLVDVKGQLSKSKMFKALKKEHKGKEWVDYTEDYKMLVFRELLSFVSLVWIILGLFSFNWVAFLAMLVLQFGIVVPISNRLRDTNAETPLYWINSLIGLSLGLFVILNSYHLKIDLLDWVLGFVTNFN